jgi:VanZ family protein
MKEKTHWSMTVVRILLIVLSLCIWVFIFYNALSDGEESSKQSHSVTVSVQEVVGAIDPDSPIATAKGEDFDILHAHVRNAAHFLQYFALGACVFGAYLSFAKKGNRQYGYIPLCLLFLTVAVDEYLQSLTIGRVSEFADFATDSVGYACGICLALLVFGLIKWAAHAARRRKSR